MTNQSSKFSDSSHRFKKFDSSPKDRHKGKCKPPQADLSLSQTISNTSLLEGDRATFTLTLKNSGSANATGVKIKDLLPSGFEFVSAEPSVGRYDSKTGIWKVDCITSGCNATLTLTGIVLKAASASAYTNIAEIIAADQKDPDSVVNNHNPHEDDYTSALAPVVNLALDTKFTLVNQQPFSNVKRAIDNNNDGKADQFIALPGDEVTFTITVTNNGFSNAKGVKIVDDLRQKLPIGLDFVSFSNLDGGRSVDTDNNAQTVEVLFDKIAPGASKTITVNAKVSTEYITPINLTGRLGTIDPDTGDINKALPEYYETPFDGTFFLNYNVQKDVSQDRVNFGFLNIQHNAEIVAVNGKELNSGAIAASSRLDVSTYKLQGTLNNGQPFQVYSVENLNNPNNSEASFFFNPDPDSGSISLGYPYFNQSEFLPNGDTGIAGFTATWVKSDDPEYLADLAVWTNLGSDGNLANIADETAVINTLAAFVEDGVYSRDRYTNGLFSFNNGNQTEDLTFEVGQFSPGLKNFVNLSVTDTGVTLTDSNNKSQNSSFSNLQAAFNSFNFSVPTGVNINIQDSNQDAKIYARLQELGGYKNNWLVSSITIDSNVQEVTFSSGKNAANYDFSFQNLIVPNTVPDFTLRGSDRASNKIIGTRFDDVIKGGNCADTLSGFDGNDTICGGCGNDLITGGKGNDCLTGGEGKDRFVFGANFGNDTISDFCRYQDKIDLSQLGLTKGVLDSNKDGVINAKDRLASLNNCNLTLDLSSLNGGSITLTGVTAVNIADFIF
ncbi:M10 family metallopeptidase C-terminal domain-containing protein [Calothrix sp. NIES-2098]|uniref:M10 family metallopeptidase C-terminal domain-containing protein n=1 Tax=Calothrix sp. NIES-2098 TaxID=1954171 RepID=UPI000B60198F|nr:hypothetical protein NIES2098_66170 [Calothrix sp. NIES-2098]